jgi:hypothetical protein
LPSVIELASVDPAGAVGSSEEVAPLGLATVVVWTVFLESAATSTVSAALPLVVASM